MSTITKEFSGKHTNVTHSRRCYTVEEVSELTTLSKATVRNMIKTGAIRVVRLGRRIVILAEDLDQLLNQ